MTSPSPRYGARYGPDVDTGCEQLHATVEDGIGVIVFDNPAKHNAMTGDMLAALGRVRLAFATDPAVRVVVVRGAGEKAFISGADIAQLGSGEIDTPPRAASTAPSPTRGALAIGKPVIAMIHGYCIGGGVMIALGADIRICSDDASFGIPAAKLGVGYPYEATSTLVALRRPRPGRGDPVHRPADGRTRSRAHRPRQPGRRRRRARRRGVRHGARDRAATRRCRTRRTSAPSTPRCPDATTSSPGSTTPSPPPGRATTSARAPPRSWTRRDPEFRGR